MVAVTYLHTFHSGTMPTMMQALHKFLKQIRMCANNLHMDNTDLSGFFTSVPHERTVASVKHLMLLFCIPVMPHCMMTGIHSGPALAWTNNLIAYNGSSKDSTERQRRQCELLISVTLHSWSKLFCSTRYFFIYTSPTSRSKVHVLACHVLAKSVT